MSESRTLTCFSSSALYSANFLGQFNLHNLGLTSRANNCAVQDSRN